MSVQLDDIDSFMDEELIETEDANEDTVGFEIPPLQEALAAGLTQDIDLTKVFNPCNNL
jgi:hypothetical protein